MFDNTLAIKINIINLLPAIKKLTHFLMKL